MATSVQTSVQNTQALGGVGLVADSWAGTDIQSKIAGEALVAGIAVVLSSGTVVAPTSGGGVTGAQGIVVADPALESADILFVDGMAVPVLRKGRIAVLFEDASSATVGSSPYVRTAGTGTKGAFRTTADGGNATQATWAKISAVDSVYGVVIVDINLP